MSSLRRWSLVGPPFVYVCTCVCVCVGLTPPTSWDQHRDAAVTSHAVPGPSGGGLPSFSPLQAHRRTVNGSPVGIMDRGCFSARSPAAPGQKRTHREWKRRCCWITFSVWILSASQAEFFPSFWKVLNQRSLLSILSSRGEALLNNAHNFRLTDTDAPGAFLRLSETPPGVFFLRSVVSSSFPPASSVAQNATLRSYVSIMISEERSSHVNKQALSFPVGLLIRSPKKRLVQLGRKPSNGSVQ